jgi:hypothetical protein
MISVEGMRVSQQRALAKFSASANAIKAVRVLTVNSRNFSESTRERKFPQQFGIFINTAFQAGVAQPVPGMSCLNSFSAHSPRITGLKSGVLLDRIYRISEMRRRNSDGAAGAAVADRGSEKGSIEAAANGSGYRNSRKVYVGGKPQ